MLSLIWDLGIKQDKKRTSFKPTTRAAGFYPVLKIANQGQNFEASQSIRNVGLLVLLCTCVAANLS